MTLILGTNSIKDTGFNVANSCRFDGSSSYMHKTPSSAGNRRTLTFSCWLKRSLPGDHTLFSVNDSTHQPHIKFDESNEELNVRISDDASKNVKTSMQFRDFSAWYHIVVAIDTTQGTASNRVKIYVNGVQQTSLSTSNYPDQNYDTSFNTAIIHSVGRAEDTTNKYFNGYMAEVVYIDGTALAPTSFGEFDEDSGIWKPINVSGLTFGTNGFYLDFEASGNLGNDANGGTDLTEVGLAATDQSLDTCTNNFSTLNPLDVSLPSTFVLSEGNLDGLMSGISSNAYARAYSNIQVASGKWYAECKITEEGDSGIIGVSARSGISYVDLSGTNYDWLGINAHDYRYYHDGTKMNNNSSSSYGTTWDGGDIIGIALDMDNLAVYFSLNGTFQASGDPTSGSSRTNAAFNLTAVASTPNGAYKFGIGTQGGTDVQGQWNFGSPPYAISSGNTDGNGFGNFEYAVPSGYFALCTKNLAEFG